MFDFGLLTLPLMSLLAVFGFAVITDVNMIAFDVKAVPKMAEDMGFNANNVRDTIMYKIHNIADVADTSRGVGYSTIGDIRLQSLLKVSQFLGIGDAALAVQGLLGLVPYRLTGKIMQEGDALHLIIFGFSSDNTSLFISIKNDKPVFDSAQIIKGQAGSLGGGGTRETKLIIANADIEIRSLLTRAAEAIVDRIDPYLLARYYFVLESPKAIFDKTIPQLARCLEVLPKQQQVWPLLLWARIYHIQGDYDKAGEVYANLININPKFPFSYLRWGETLAKLGRHEEAMTMYQYAINNSRYYPKYPMAKSAAYSLWADSYIAIGQIDKAETVLRTGVENLIDGYENSSATALSHYSLGNFLMQHKGDLQNAEHHLRHAVYLDDEPEYYIALQDLMATQIPGYGEYITQLRKAKILNTSPKLPLEENGEKSDSDVMPEALPSP